MTLRRPARRSAPVALGDPVDRTRLLHLLARTDRIAFFQKLGEGRVSRLDDLLLKLLGQIREGDVGMDCLNVAQELVRKPA